MTAGLVELIFVAALSGVPVGSAVVAEQAAVPLAAGQPEEAAAAAEPLRLPAPGSQLAARDSLRPPRDDDQDAADCLRGLTWDRETFSVSVDSAEEGRGDRIVRFPSPVRVSVSPSGASPVAMEWYAARDDAGHPCPAPAIVVVHESGRGMTVGRLFARGFHAQGVHAFLIHLPGYGDRSADRSDRPDAVLLRMKQGIADVRRARDAVAALPLVDAARVGLQGTSLGGFVAATVAGVDSGFQQTFIVLAGGNLHDVILSGRRDAEKARERLFEAGLDAAAIRRLTRPIEPLRLAHRIRPECTWLYTGRYDDVVPPRCSDALAAAARLPPEHHIRLPADHYSGIVFLPTIILDISTRMKSP